MAASEDVIITAGFGMTAVINKLQRILGLKIPEQFKEGYLANGYPSEKMDKSGSPKRPIVFVTHMEHHSNHTSWIHSVHAYINDDWFKEQRWQDGCSKDAAERR